MRSIAVIVVFALLSACGAPEAISDAEPTEPAPAPAAETAPASPFAGGYTAVSPSATASLGDMNVEDGALRFASGGVVATRTLGARDPSEEIAQLGETYAALNLRSETAAVELRAVVSQDGGAGVCGGSATHVALLRDAQIPFVLLVGFSGDEAPGPQATRSQVCEVYGYEPA